MVRRSKRKMTLPPGDSGGGGGGDATGDATTPAPAASRNGNNTRNRNKDTTKVFIYTGQHGDGIPRDITHVRVDPSVTKIFDLAFFCAAKLVAIELNEGLETIGSQSFYNCSSIESIILPSTMKDVGQHAFDGCKSLVNVQLNEGLEKIGSQAFGFCKSLTSIIFPSTVRCIDYRAFGVCEKLARVTLNEGLENIAEFSFQNCDLLTSITIPTTVKVLHRAAFYQCKKLANVQLNEGLEIIESETFSGCESLEFVRVPSTVKSIEFDAFKECTRLVAIEFSAEFEEFVSETSLQEWWYRGNSEHMNIHILETYSFICRNCIAKRFRMLKPLKWRQAMNDMLSVIPTINLLFKYQSGHPYRSNEMLVEHCDMIDSKLTVFEKLADIATLIELALMVHQLHTCSAGVIIPNVLSFLMVDKWPASTSEI